MRKLISLILILILTLILIPISLFAAKYDINYKQEVINGKNVIHVFVTLAGVSVWNYYLNNKESTLYPSSQNTLNAIIIENLKTRNKSDTYGTITNLITTSNIDDTTTAGIVANFLATTSGALAIYNATTN